MSSVPSFEVLFGNVHSEAARSPYPFRLCWLIYLFFCQGTGTAIFPMDGCYGKLECHTKVIQSLRPALQISSTAKVYKESYWYSDDVKQESTVRERLESNERKFKRKEVESKFKIHVAIKNSTFVQ